MRNIIAVRVAHRNPTGLCVDDFCACLRRIIVERSMNAGVGHIGSALSVANILSVLFARTLRVCYVNDPERDRFILSKGHAALALYGALYLRGWLTLEQLETFCANGSHLGVHPDRAVTAIDFSTGSLGHGLAMAAGAALAARLQHSCRRAFVVLSDAECNEGSTWESVMFAAHHRLSNLIAIVDLDGQQAFGYTRDVLDLTQMAARWSVFGWDVHELDGHDNEAIETALAGFDTVSGAPHVIIARTTFGKGVSFMENRIEWHYQPLSRFEYQRAMFELGANRGFGDDR